MSIKNEGYEKLQTCNNCRKINKCKIYKDYHKNKKQYKQELISCSYWKAKEEL